MRRLPVLFLVLALCVSLFAASASHAMEQLACADTVGVTAIGHYEGDRDEVPADSDRGYPHHHGVCHGHEIAAETASATVLKHDRLRAEPVPAHVHGLVFATADPALRPPQA